MNNILSQYDLDLLMEEIKEIRKTNLQLDPDIDSEYSQLCRNITRLTEIKNLAQQHLNMVKTGKRHLRIV